MDDARTGASEPERAAALVAAAVGPVEILVANTGGPPFGGALDHDIAEWELAYRSLVLAPVALAKAVVPGMRERGWGRIVNVGSNSTREPIPGLNLSNSHRMAAGDPFPWDLTEGAKGVQLAELALRSAAEGRRLEVPELGA